MSKEDFVSDEQALALKKLGFKEPCLYHYDHQMLIPNESKIDSEYIPLDEFYRSMNDEYSKQYGICDAPTLAQVQKWLRREKNYSVEPKYDAFKWFCCVTCMEDSSWFDLPQEFSSYEEALSSGISECLNLLKNGRNR